MRIPWAPARLAALGLVLQAFGARAADQLLCDEPVLEGGLKVAFSTQLNLGKCGLLKPTLDTAVAQQQCISFCNLGGAQLGLPILLGTKEYGFNLDDMNEICLGSDETDVIINNQTLMNYCSERGNELHGIKLRHAEFVTSVNSFKEQQILHRANMKVLMRELQKKLFSDDFNTKMKGGTDDAYKLELLKAEFVNFTSEAAALSSDTQALGQAMKDLTVRSQALADTVETNLDRFDEFISNCNLMLLGTSEQNEYLLDICVQDKDLCVNETNAEHIGCCCGLNPVTAGGIFNIDAEVSSGSRLQGQRPESLDVCAKARKDGSAAAEALKAEVDSLGVGDMYNAYQIKLKQKYAKYHRMCLTTPSRRLEETGGASVGEGKPESASAEEEGRRLASCTPPVLAEQNLKVAFTKQADTKRVCKTLDPKIDNTRMKEQCDSFCGSESVAMLLGTEEYGFSMDQANSICLPPNGVLLHNDTLFLQCRGWSDAFREIEVLTGNFTRDLEIFNAAVLLHTAANRQAVKLLQDYMKTNEFTDKVHHANRLGNGKINVVKAAIRDRLETTEATEARDTLREKAIQLRTSASVLNEQLNKNLPLINRFLSECNELFTGVGAQREYLLDICAQESDACFDTDEAEHVSCCCAYSPFAFLGQMSTIPGVSALPEGAWVEDSRRRSDSAAPAAPAAGVFDICMDAWTTAVPAIAELRDRIKKTDFEEVLTDYLERGKETYGGHFCDYSVTGDNGNGVGSASGARARSMPGFAAAAALLVLQARSSSDIRR